MTAIGTGGRRYAEAFIEDERVPFPVVLDEDGNAAAVIETKTMRAASLIKPSAILAGLRSTAGGHRQHRTGRRPMQLGATVVIGPGDELIYEDFEDHAGDHADLDEVIAALEAR